MATSSGNSPSAGGSSSTSGASSPVGARVNVMDFGADPNESSPDTFEIQAAAAYAANLPGAELYFPPGAGYRVDDTIQIAPGIDVDQRAPLICHTEDVSCLVIGESSVTNGNVSLRGLSVVRAEQSDWADADDGVALSDYPDATDVKTDATDIGIQIFNLNTSHVEIKQAERFTVGVRLHAYSAGVAYNQFELGSLAANHSGLDLVNEVGGWVNENVFLGGRFTVWSSTGTNQNRYGIRLNSLDDTYLNTNNNVFLKPSFELKDVHGSGVALPVLIVEGTQNSFLKYRSEGNGSVAAVVLGRSHANLFKGGFDQAAVIDDRSEVPTSALVNSRQEFMDRHDRQLLHFNLLERVNQPVSQFTQALGMALWASSGNTFAHLSSSASMTPREEGCLELAGSTALGFRVDTSQTKSLMLTRGAREYVADDGQTYLRGGRFLVKPYDKDGNALVPSEGYRPVMGAPGNEGYFSSSWDGVFITGNDSISPWVISLEDDVDHVMIGVVKGTMPACLSSVAVFTQQASGSTGTSFANGLAHPNSTPLSPAMPEQGSWQVGDVVKNSSPSVVAGSVLEGWLRLTSGNSHVPNVDWVPRYVITQ